MQTALKTKDKMIMETEYFKNRVVKRSAYKNVFNLISFAK